jgi:hypothetical protein
MARDATPSETVYGAPETGNTKANRLARIGVELPPRSPRLRWVGDEYVEAVMAETSVYGPRDDVAARIGNVAAGRVSCYLLVRPCGGSRFPTAATTRWVIITTGADTGASGLWYC